MKIKLPHESFCFQDIEDTNILDYLSMSETAHVQIKQYTQTDTTLQALLTTVLAGWPPKKYQYACVQIVVFGEHSGMP